MSLDLGGSAISSTNPMPNNIVKKNGMSPTYTAAHITTKTTTTPVASTCYVSTLVIAVSAAGSACTLVVQDKGGTPKILVPSFTIAVPTTGSPIVLQLDEPILMTGGVDIITAGTTAGTVDVFLTYWQ